MQRGLKWTSDNIISDLVLPAKTKIRNARADVQLINGSIFRRSHLKLTIEFETAYFDVKHECTVFPGSPALACTYSFRKGAFFVSKNGSGIEGEDKKTNDSRAMPDEIVSRIPFIDRHWRADAISFKVRTDHNDTLVQYEQVLPSRKGQQVVGNLLILFDETGLGQLFIAKESPASSDQVGWTGLDFIVRFEALEIPQVGFVAEDFEDSEWVQGYPIVLGLLENSEKANLSLIREYQNTQWGDHRDREPRIVINTWGDRSRDSVISHKFLEKEIEAVSRLGATHLQLDDGWQSGPSANSRVNGKGNWRHWQPSDWEVNSQRFPNGLAPFVELAANKGVRLSLWFNPSSVSNYESWREDASTLTRLNQELGIRTFKIDGLNIPTNRASQNVRKLLSEVVVTSGGTIDFNLDVTADQRPGYFSHYEYGNIFLENRYTDYGNYYPYRTLRNLWMLSRYIPPQRLQIEFLNIWRNPLAYPLEDRFAPSNVTFEYAFAITIPGQPLGWFEASSLPDEAFQLRPVIDEYKSVVPRLASATVLPVGDEPSGSAWTGFQFIESDQSGYLLIFRELHNDECHAIPTWLAAGSYKFNHVIGSIGRLDDDVGREGLVNFCLPTPHSYRLVEYRSK